MFLVMWFSKPTVKEGFRQPPRGKQIVDKIPSIPMVYPSFLKTISKLRLGSPVSRFLTVVHGDSSTARGVDDYPGMPNEGKKETKPRYELILSLPSLDEKSKLPGTQSVFFQVKSSSSCTHLVSWNLSPSRFWKAEPGHPWPPRPALAGGHNVRH
jgi:hypothetical protein